MSFVPEIYQRMLAALQAQHSPNTSHDHRRAAMAELEAFKQRDDMVEYAVFILSRTDVPEHDDFTRHFALQVISTFRVQWNRPTLAQRRLGRLGTQTCKRHACTRLTDLTSTHSLKIAHARTQCLDLAAHTFGGEMSVRGEVAHINTHTRTHTNVVKHWPRRMRQ